MLLWRGRRSKQQSTGKVQPRGGRKAEAGLAEDEGKGFLKGARDSESTRFGHVEVTGSLARVAGARGVGLRAA